MLNTTMGMRCPKPEGAFYVYPDCSGLIGRRTPKGAVITDDSALVGYLLEEARVAAVASREFHAVRRPSARMKVA